MNIQWEICIDIQYNIEKIAWNVNPGEKCFGKKTSMWSVEFLTIFPSVSNFGAFFQVYSFDFFKQCL